MKRILLTSHGINTKLGYDKIARAMVLEDNSDKKILLITDPVDEIQNLLRARAEQLGFAKKNIWVLEAANVNEVKNIAFDVIYVSEGNTFSILAYMKKLDILDHIRQCAMNGADYIGASAGAHIAGQNISAAYELEEGADQLTDYTALGLLDGIVLPHFRLERYSLYKKLRESGEYKEIYLVSDDGILEACI